MGTLTLTDVTTGQPILASNINNGWSALRTVINGGIDESNFASGELYSLNKLKQSGATANHTLYWTGTEWDNIAARELAVRDDIPILYSRDSSTVTVTNTIAETSLMTQTIVGGYMDTDKMVRATILGDLAATGAVACTFRIYFGGVVLWGDAMTTVATVGSTPVPYVFEIWLANSGAATIQVLVARMSFSGNAAGSVAGLGNEVGTVLPFATQNANVLVMGESVGAGINADTGSNQAFSLTVQWASASANVSIRRHFWSLELI